MCDLLRKCPQEKLSRERSRDRKKPNKDAARLEKKRLECTAAAKQSCEAETEGLLEECHQETLCQRLCSGQSECMFGEMPRTSAFYPWAMW